MMAIVGFGCIQVKGKLLEFWLKHIMEVDENFKDQEHTGMHSWCTD